MKSTIIYFFLAYNIGYKNFLSEDKILVNKNLESDDMQIVMCTIMIQSYQCENQWAKILKATKSQSKRRVQQSTSF